MYFVVLQMTLSNQPNRMVNWTSFWLAENKVTWLQTKPLRFCPNLLVCIIATCGIWWLPLWCWCPAYRCCWGSTICTLISSVLVEGFMQHPLSDLRPNLMIMRFTCPRYCTCNVCSFKHFMATKMVQKPVKEVEPTKLSSLFRKPGVYNIRVYYICPPVVKQTGHLHIAQPSGVYNKVRKVQVTISCFTSLHCPLLLTGTSAFPWCVLCWSNPLDHWAAN